MKMKILLGDGVVYALVVFEKDAAQRCYPGAIFCGRGLEDLERTCGRCFPSGKRIFLSKFAHARYS